MARQLKFMPTSVKLFDANKQLIRQDIEILDDMLVVNIKWSKTRQYGHSRQVPVVAIPNCCLCPVTAFKAMIETISARALYPAFCFHSLVKPKILVPITYKQFQDKFRNTIALTGRDASLFSTHSLRRGGCSFAFRSKVKSDLIQYHGDRSILHMTFIKSSQFHIKCVTEFCLIFSFVVARRPLTFDSDHNFGFYGKTSRQHTLYYSTVISGHKYITGLQQKIRYKMASINYKYTLLLVGTNNIDDRSRTVDEIMSYYNDLITTIKSRSSTRIIVSAIIPRPCDLKIDPFEQRVKDMNKKLKKMSTRGHLQFLHTFRIFLHNNKPIRSYYAVNDRGLHLNLEGVRRLRSFFVNTVAHLQ